jgi:hypothetical protein
MPAAGTITSFEEIAMNFYYSAAACSLAPHIALEESGVSHDSSRSAEHLVKDPAPTAA